MANQMERQMNKWTFRSKKTGRFVACRINQLERCADDPMNAYAPIGDIYGDARRRDVRDGCPRCTEEVAENASEPDVMQRWGFR